MTKKDSIKLIKGLERFELSTQTGQMGATQENYDALIAGRRDARTALGINQSLAGARFHPNFLLRLAGIAFRVGRKDIAEQNIEKANNYTTR